MKHLYLGLSPGLLFTFSFSSVRIVAREHMQPIFGGVRAAWNKSQKSVKSLTVRTAGLFARNITSFALCFYLIGLFNRMETNRKHKRKRMWFGCEQPFLWGEHCVTSQKTAAEETSPVIDHEFRHNIVKNLSASTSTSTSTFIQLVKSFLTSHQLNL